MARNLKFQFLNAVDKNFKEGQDKHSIKHSEGIGNGRIFSYSDRTNLIDLSANFSNYMRENHREIKMIREIKPEHIQGFFNKCSKTCSNKTLEQYKSRLMKLEKLVNKTYNIKSNLSKGYEIPASNKNTSKIRNVSMTRNEFNRLMNSMETCKSAARIGIELGGRFGLRVSEVVKLKGRDICLDKGIISIVDSKAGRDRDIVIREVDRAFCERLSREYKNNERIVPLKEGSVNKFLGRQLEKCDLRERFREAKSGMHSIRKMVAQEHYDRCRAQGMSIKESLDLTSSYLGHGDNRDALMKEYVLNIE